MAETTTVASPQIIKSYSAKPKISTNPINEEIHQQEVKNSPSSENVKVINGSVTTPQTPKKIYVIKTVKNQSLLEKLKSGQIIVKKIVLPGNKTPEDAKKLPTPGRTPNIHIQENIRLEGPKKEVKETPKLVILSDQRIPKLPPKKVFNVEKKDSVVIKDKNDSEEIKDKKDSEDIKDKNDLEEIKHRNDSDDIKNKNDSNNIKEDKDSDNIKDNDSEDLDDTKEENDSYKTDESDDDFNDEYTPNKKFKSIEVRDMNRKRNRRKPVYLRNDYLNPDFSDESEDEEEEEEPTNPPIKRKRGRPKRTETMETTENEENIPNTSSSDIMDTTISPVKKRGPGRPRKHNLDESQKIETPSTSPRKRGRPRKTLREFVENVEPKSCWSNVSDHNDPDFEPDSKGFKVTEATSAAQCHRVLEQELENLEDDLPLSSVKDLPPKKQKKKRTPLPIKKLDNTRIQELIPKEFPIDAPPTHLLIDNCHYPIVTNLRKLTIDPSKPLLIIDRETAKNIIYSFITNLDNYNIILKDENFENEPLTQFLKTPLLKEIIVRKKISFVTNQVLAQYFQAASN